MAGKEEHHKRTQEAIEASARLTTTLARGPSDPSDIAEMANWLVALGGRLHKVEEALRRLEP